MIPFADMLPPAARSDLLIFIEVLFWIYVPVSFIYVSSYVMKQSQAGRLLDSGNAPLAFSISGIAGWFFILCVLELIFIQNALYFLLVFVGIFGLLMETGRTASEQFGLSRLSPFKLITWSLLICGAVVLVEVPLTQVMERVMTLLHVPHPDQGSVETFRHYTQASDIFGFMVLAVILSPLVEELFFRGFFLTFLKNYTSTWLAIILSAGVFAFAHANLGSAIPLWFLGIVLGVAYQHTGSLLLPICIHSCFNLITAMSLLLEKGTP